MCTQARAHVLKIVKWMVCERLYAENKPKAADKTVMSRSTRKHGNCPLWKQSRHLPVTVLCDSLSPMCPSPHISFPFHFNSSVTWNTGRKHECLHTWFDWDAAAVASVSDRPPTLSRLYARTNLRLSMWVTGWRRTRPCSSPVVKHWYRIICWKHIFSGSVAWVRHVAHVMSHVRRRSLLSYTSFTETEINKSAAAHTHTVNVRPSVRSFNPST